MRIGYGLHSSDRGAVDFRAALEEAQEQLDWGTDLDDLRAASWALALFDPAHILVRQLDRKADRLVTIDVTLARPALPRA